NGPGNPQGLSVIALGSVEVAVVALGTGEGVQADGDIFALGAQGAQKLHNFAVSRDSGSVIPDQFMPVTAQADGDGLLSGTGLSLAPVGLGAVGAGEHFSRLFTQIVDPAGIISSPAGIPEIFGRYGSVFSVPREGEPFI